VSGFDACCRGARAGMPSKSVWRWYVESHHFRFIIIWWRWRVCTFSGFTQTILWYTLGRRCRRWWWIKCHHAADAVSPLSSCIFVEIHTTGYERTLGGRITHTPQYYFFRKGLANNPSPFAHRGLFFVVRALTRVSAGAHNNMGFPSSRNKHLTRPRAARCSRLYINLSSRTPHRRTSPNALNAQNFCLRTAGQSGRLAFKRSS